MPIILPLPKTRRLCDCGRLASYTMIAPVGWPTAKPAHIALCTVCAAEELRVTPRQLVAGQVAACGATAS